MKRRINEMKLRLPAFGINEGVARSVISAFAAELNPTVEELGDLRCAVSEAVTNAIVHGYRGAREPESCYIYISVRLYNNGEITVAVTDLGVGIEDIPKAMSQSYTTDPEGERSGMGFLVMQSFTDSVTVKSSPGNGTTVLMRKIFKPDP